MYECVEVKRYRFSWKTAEIPDINCHMESHRVTDTGERASPNDSQTDWYSIYLPRSDERLS